MSYLPLSVWKNPHKLIIGEVFSSAFNFDLIFFILANNKDNYQSLNEFEFGRDPIIYFGVSSP